MIWKKETNQELYVLSKIENPFLLSNNLLVSSFFILPNSSSTEVVVDLKEVIDSNRDEFVQAINDLDPNGKTCLGDGIMKGMDVSDNVY